MMSLVTENGVLCVGDSIADAIRACVVTKPVNVIRDKGEELKAEFKAAEKALEPVVVDYSGTERIDAYCVYYLPRNTLVPKLALLCCSHHPQLREFDDKLSILDLGSGTGGVVLGLLDLFQNDELAACQLNILALDSSEESLERQENLVQHIGRADSIVQQICVDLEDPSTYKRKLKSGAPYDMVFAANVFAELSGDAVEGILETIAPLLVEGGIIVNVESENNYAKLQRARVAGKARELGLYRYYPCPPDSPCPKQGHPKGCWVWREDNFKCAEIKLGPQTLCPTDIQRAHLMILCTEPYSVHDVLEKINPNLTWGVVESRYGEEEAEEKGMVKEDYLLCMRHGGQRVRQTRKKKLIFGRDAIPRGVFVGFSADFSEIETWDIL